MVDFNEMIKSTYLKMDRGQKLSKGEMLLLLIDKTLNANWGVQRLTNLPYQPGSIEGRVDNILVIQTSSIGDVVYTTPALRGLRERYPHSHISLLTSETPKEIILGNPNVNKVFSFPREQCLKDFREGKKNFTEIIAEIYRPIQRLQFSNFDLILNLSVTPMSAVLTHLIGGRNVWGLMVDEFGRPKLVGCVWSLYTFYIKANRVMQDLNRLDLMELHLRMADVNPSKRELLISIETEIKNRCLQILDDYGVKQGDLVIGLNPGAGFRSRCWLKERFAQLGDRLNEEYGAKIILFGGPKEEDLAKEIAEMMNQRPINLAGKTFLKELAAYLSRCDCLITNDTGAMHIAAAIGVPVIAICGPTRVGPLGKEGHLLLQADLECIGCGTTSVCTKGDCMRAIPVEAVLEALRYQRGELREPPGIEGVNIYTASKEEPGRLFFYQVLNKRNNEEFGDEILKLLYLNLWIRENNRLGFYPEKEITPQEMQYELAKRFSLGEIATDIKGQIEKLKDYQALCHEAVGYLRDGRRDEDSLAKHQAMVGCLYEEVGRFFSLYDFLYPESLSGDPLARSLMLCQQKGEAARYMESFLKEWKEALL